MEDKNGKAKKRQITFDLGENKLRMYYPKPAFTLNPMYYKKAWKDIAKFMRQQDFEHRQYSVYVSSKPMTSVEINALVKNMVQAMPWLNQCLNAMDVTNIGKQHSLMTAVEEASRNLGQNKTNEAEAKNDIMANRKENFKESVGLSMSEWENKMNSENNINLTESKADYKSRDIITNEEERE